MASAADSSAARASAAGAASSAAGSLCARRPPFARPDSPEPTSNGGSEVSRMAVLEAWPAGGTRARWPAGALAREPGSRIRFGARCDAAWTRIWQTWVGDRVEITAPGIPPQRAAVADKFDARGYLFTPMVPARQLSALHACLMPASGDARECVAPQGRAQRLAASAERTARVRRAT
ncbi:DUF2690 domain-containing protein [Streptomyces chartreusis]